LLFDACIGQPVECRAVKTLNPGLANLKLEMQSVKAFIARIQVRFDFRSRPRSEGGERCCSRRFDLPSLQCEIDSVSWSARLFAADDDLITT
jgi:hypothetical protein